MWCCGPLDGGLRDIIDSCLAKSATDRPALTELVILLHPRAALGERAVAKAAP